MGNTQRHLLQLTTSVVLSTSITAYAADISFPLEHAKANGHLDEIAVRPGERIVVSINNTCPDRFEYQAIAFEVQPPMSKPGAELEDGSTPCPSVAQAEEKLAAQGFCEMKTQTLSFTHHEDARSYKIDITQRGSADAKILGLSSLDFDATVKKMQESNSCAVPPEMAKKATPLGSAVFLLDIESSPWALGMSGGLTISDVVDPRFAIVDDPASTTTPVGNLVIRDRGAEDSEKLGFAGFLHVHHERWKLKGIPIAGTFGLGIQEQNSISGFVGVSAAAFDLAYLTLGWNWSSVDRLPAGQRLGAAPINDNVLTDLPSKVDSGWFLGISFKLMSPGESFFKKKVAVPEPEEKGKKEVQS